MPRLILFAVVLGCLASFGCSKFQPIITPQEYEAACRANPAGADPACAARVCEVYQAVVTDYYENMAGCQATCRTRAQELFASTPAACEAKVAAARDACLQFCNRKFYRCNCDK